MQLCVAWGQHLLYFITCQLGILIDIYAHVSLLKLCLDVHVQIFTRDSM